MSEYSGNKPQKVQWMINNVSTEPSLDIIRQANENGWLCKNKDGTGGWNDFLTDGLILKFVLSDALNFPNPQ